MAIASGIGLIGLVLYLFILLLPVALLVVLQVWLCRKNVKLGLILPGLSLALSLVLVFSMAAYSTVRGGVNVQIIDENGQVVQSEPEIVGNPQPAQITAGQVAAVGVLFLVTNIPTVVFGGIWLHYKGRRDTLEDLKRMRIEDLE